MCIEYASLRGSLEGMDLTAITEIAEYFENELEQEISPRTPFVGRNFNATRAGIHADGMLKDQEIYNIFNTEKLLNRPATVAVDAHSGLAGIAFWVNRYYKLNDEYCVDKRSELVVKIKEMVDNEYAQGRNTVMGDIELDGMVAQVDPKMHLFFTHHSMAKYEK